MNNLKHIFLFLLVTSCLLSCATKKRKSDNEPGAVKKFYHNLTAKYNGYFNANELLENGLATLNDMHQDNYSDLLEVYPYSDVDNPGAIAGDMDIAMQKVAKVVAVHNPSHWVDDCYVLLGKSQFYKQDYETAQETFEYFEEEFDPSNPNSRLYNKSKNKRKSPDDKKKQKEIDQKIKEENFKKAKREKQKTREEEKEDRAENKREEVNFKNDIKKIKADLRKATKKRKEEEKKKRKKAREKKERIKKDSNTDPRSKKEIELEKKLFDKETAFVQFKKGSDNVEQKTLEQKAIEDDIALMKEEDKREEEQIIKTKKKKKKISDGGGLFKHKPVFHEGVYWLARTYIERENYFSADYLLRKLENDYPTSNDIRKELPAAFAHLYLRQKDYDQAIPHLGRAIESTGDKKLRARYAYIIGQIHLRAGRESDAKFAFENVKDHKPDYSMEFNSKLHLAKSEYKSGQNDKTAVIKRLEKMTRDNKNNDFQDQIYYTIGEIKEEDGDIKGAISAYQSSVGTSTINKLQKMESYFKIAQIYFKTEEFVSSKNYYDSTLTIIDLKDIRYNHVNKYARSLGELSRYMETIELQDSLLTLSLKSPEEQRDVVIKILEEQRLLAKEMGDKKEVVTGKKGRVSKGFGSSESSFFAYNPTVVLGGKRIFKDRWGERKLTDNWRRSNRSGAFTEDIIVEDSEEENGISDEEIAAMLKSIPMIPPQKDKAHGKIEESLYKLGILFRDKLTHNEKSIEYLERLLSDYPNTENKMDTYFYLYLAYTDTDQSAYAQKYSDLLKEYFPNSQYTLSITDPSYFEKYKTIAETNDEYYAQTFDMFELGSHEKVLERVEEAFKSFGKGNVLFPKFALLQAMSIGNIDGKEAYISSLQGLVTKYPNTPEETRAKEILRFLRGDVKAFDKAFYEEDEELFTLDDDKLHYIIVIIYDKSESVLNTAKIKISNYNKKYHRIDKLRISDIYLSQEEEAESQLILVRKFRNKSKAMAYYSNVEKNAKSFLTQEEVGFEIFATTQKNYREIAKKKNVTAYREFFEENYLKK